MKIRVGAVSYLNARPLTHGFEQGIAADRIELTHAVPSVLAQRMAEGALDVALLPTIELARLIRLTIVPGISISSVGAAASVLLVSKRPLREVRRVALDPESRTSNALAQVLLAEHWKASPTSELGSGDLEADLASHDAVVRIGDKALFEPVPVGTTAHDLGRAWHERTRLPFVFAVWAALPAVVDRALYVAFHDSRREGLRSVESIARDHAWRGSRNPEVSLRYLTTNMRYRLGAMEVEAMRKFLRAAAALGLVLGAPEPRLAYFSETACREAAIARGRA